MLPARDARFNREIRTSYLRNIRAHLDPKQADLAQNDGLQRQYPNSMLAAAGLAWRRGRTRCEGGAVRVLTVHRRQSTFREAVWLWPPRFARHISRTDTKGRPEAS